MLAERRPTPYSLLLTAYSLSHSGAQLRICSDSSAILGGSSGAEPSANSRPPGCTTGAETVNLVQPRPRPWVPVGCPCCGLSLGSERRRATLERGAPSGANSASLPRGGLETPPQDGANPNPNPSQPCHPRRQAAPGRRLRHSPPALSQLEAEHKVFSLELRLWLEAEQLQSVDLRPGDRVSITVKLRVLGLGFGMRRTRL